MQPFEPVLPLHDVQGVVVPGFAEPHQRLVGIVISACADSSSRFKWLLRSLASENPANSQRVASAAVTLRHRREYRQLRRQQRTPYPENAPSEVLLAVGFAFAGLQKLTSDATCMPGAAFKAGLAARSPLLGDPTDPTNDGNPAKWKVGGPACELDALFVIAGDLKDRVDDYAEELRRRLCDAGCVIAYDENGDIRADLPGREHFGFDDGVSQPGIRGRASEAPDDFITERHIARDQLPETCLFGYPGQDLLWPGEFILGHPASSPDPAIPGPVTPATPDWTRNGSFLVYRRLRQDVGLFWQTMQDLAEQLAVRPGFGGIDDIGLAARLVGRWPSGAPVSRVPLGDDRMLGRQQLANNHIRFDSSCAMLPLASGYEDRFPMANADPLGVTCPLAAHVRKVNTRDSASDLGGREATYTRRILRVGIPYGTPVPFGRRRDADNADRGILFLSIQASIENQFEFLQARWMNNAARPKMPGGHDMVVGQNGAPGEDRKRTCTLFGTGFEQAQIQTDAQWIIPTGGGYFFVPSISALRDVLGRDG